MRGAARLVAAVLACLGAGCTTTVDVAFDEREDFSRYRTWDWLPGAGSVYAPADDTAALGEDLARLLEQTLAERGLRRVGEGADLLLAYRLRVLQQRVIVHTTSAVEQLSSMTSDGSYEIQATRIEVETYENAQLVVVLVDPRGRRVVWRGEVHGRYRDHFAPNLEDAVASLLERLPTLASAGAEPALPSLTGEDR